MTPQKLKSALIAAVLAAGPVTADSESDILKDEYNILGYPIHYQ